MELIYLAQDSFCVKELFIVKDLLSLTGFQLSGDEIPKYVSSLINTSKLFFQYLDIIQYLAWPEKHSKNLVSLAGGLLLRKREIVCHELKDFQLLSKD